MTKTVDEKPTTGIYWGSIMHNRFSPKRHYFTYPVFMFSVDLEEVESSDRKLWLFRHNRFSLYSLRDSDHLNTSPQPSPSGEGEERKVTKRAVISLLRQRGYTGPVDQVFLVTQFRVLGYLFNPVSFYYCYSNGVEVAYVAEVGNTFHQRHCYTFFEGASLGQKSFWVDKVFYVSPFLEMDLIYNFRFDKLGKSLGVYVDDYKGDQPVLKTFIRGTHRELSDWNLLVSFLKIPLMSLWIIAWIHWHALKLWLKKVPLVFRPLDGMKPGWVEGSSSGSNSSAPTKSVVASEPT